MDEPTPTLSELKKITTLNNSTIERIIEGFLSSYNRGLTKDHSTMIPSYVSRLPTGTETGTYLALDLSITCLKVAVVVTLVGFGKTNIDHKKYEIPVELKCGSVEKFFDWVALKVKLTLNETGHDSTSCLYTGVNFGFSIK